ncbi:MAG: fibronectin type III domain-containing protein [Bacteroidota bacterium]
MYSRRHKHFFGSNRIFSPITIPAVVSGFSATTASSSSISLTWSPPDSDGGSTILGYYLYWKRSSDSIYIKSDLLTSPNATISGLSPNTSYDFYTTSENVEGESDPSNIDLAITESAPTPTNTARIAYFVANTGSISSQDQAIISRLTNTLGYTVTVFNHEATVPPEDDYDFAYVSENVSSGVFGSKLLNWARPVIFAERAVGDEHGFSSDNFAISTGTSIVIENSASPFAAGLSGTVTIFNSNEEFIYQDTEDLVADADSVGSEVGDSSDKILVFLESGDTLSVGGTAPADRVMSFLNSDTGFAALTTDGLAIFDAMFSYFAPILSTGLNDGFEVVATPGLVALNNGSAVASYDDSTGKYAYSTPYATQFANSEDRLGGVAKQIAGDLQMILRVESTTDNNNNSYFSLQARKSLNDDSAYISVLQTANSSGARRVTLRETDGANSIYSDFDLSSPPQLPIEWYLIKKTGNTFSLRFSKNGLDWTSFQSIYTIDLGTSPYWGFFASNLNFSTTQDWAFDNMVYIIDDPYVEPTTPDPPQNLVIIASANGQLSLSWEDSANLNGGVFDRYNIYVRTQGENTFPPTPYGASLSTEVIVSGLANDTIQEVVVRTLTDIGESPDSNIVAGIPSSASTPIYACANPSSNPPVFKESSAGYAVCEASEVWRPSSGGPPQIVTVSDLNPNTIRSISDLPGNVIIIPLISGISNLAGNSLTMDSARSIFCGWAAPDIGYSIENGPLIIQDGAGTIVMSHFGARGGSQMGGQNDSISIRNQGGFTVLDRVSATRAIDGANDGERSDLRVDVRHCFFSRMLYKTASDSGNGPNNGGYHPEQLDGFNQAHNFCGLWGSNTSATNINVSSSFNVLDSHRQRSWLWRGFGDVLQLYDFIQNYGERAGRAIACSHITYFGCTWRTGQDGQTRWPGAHDLAPLQADNPFNSTSGNTAWVSNCEFIRAGVPQNLSDQFAVFRSINSARKASGWNHHNDSGGFELMPYVIDPSIVGTGQTRIDNIVNAAGMKPFNLNPEDAAEKIRIKDNTSMMQLGEFQYSTASKNGSGQVITLADLGITLDGTENDLLSNGRTRIEDQLLNLKNQREIQFG